MSSPKNNPGNECSTVVYDFIARCRDKEGGERSDYQLFIFELCYILGVLRNSGWFADLSGEEILALLVALSHPRSEVEKTATSAGSVRSIEFFKITPNPYRTRWNEKLQTNSYDQQRSTIQSCSKDLANQIRAVRFALEDHSIPANATPSPNFQKRSLRPHRAYPRKPPCSQLRAQGGGWEVCGMISDMCKKCFIY